MRVSVLVLLVAVLIFNSLQVASDDRPLTEWWTDWASLDEGAAITSPSKLKGGSELEGIIGKRVNDDIGCIFADVAQREEFTIDLGQTRRLGFFVFQCELQRRTPKCLLVQVSDSSARGPWKTVFETDRVMQNHTFAVDDGTPARWVRVDLGERTDGIGSRVRLFRVFPRYHLKPADRLIQEFSKHFCRDLPDLAAFWKAIDEKRWNDACDELIERYAARAPFFSKEYEEAQPHPLVLGMMENRVTDGGHTYQFDSSDWDWNALAPGAPGASLGMLPGAYSIFHGFTVAYIATGDEKYARKTAELLTDWLQDNVCPGWDYDQNGDLIEAWAGLRTAGRAGVWERMVAVWCANKKTFSRDLKINLIYSLWEHLDLLHAIRVNLGGNWLTNVNSSLFCVGLNFPEFVEQKQWIEDSVGSFETTLLRDVFSCGRECEDSTMYVPIASGHILGQYAKLRKAGLRLSDEAERRVSHLYDAIAWVCYPDGSGPAVGDCGRVSPLRRFGHPVPDEFLELFDRPDLVYINSEGKEGTVPAETSKAFAGWYILRSPWEERPYEDARQVFFKVSPNRTHGHQDQLQVLLYAYGRELLTDPAMVGYGMSANKYYTSAAYHNTVCVNESDQKHEAGKEHAWAAGKGFDFVDGEFHYGTVLDRRQILFVKSGGGLSDYWLVRDRLNGRSVEHTFDVNWHLSEDAEPVVDGRTVRTTYGDGGNLLIYGVGDCPAPTLEDYSICDRIRGPVPAKCVRYRLKTTPCVGFDTLLLPYKGTEPPRISADNLKLDGLNDPRVATALTVRTEAGQDLLFLSVEPGMKHSFENGKLVTDAQALALRFDRSGKLVGGFQYGGSTSSWNGRTVIALDEGESHTERVCN